jgi:UPF0176 protein
LNPLLHNRIRGSILKENLVYDPLERITLSFYKYHKIINPDFFRDHLYLNLSSLNVLGRIYTAREGINAQVSVPKKNFESFSNFIRDISFLQGINLNNAIGDNGKSFFKLKIKVRNKIVADGLDDSGFDVTDCGQRLTAFEFNDLATRKDTVIIDMRNHYESEIGHFRNALLPDADTFREALHIAGDLLAPHRDKNIIMYCTGGIRCEKASAWFKYKGFPNIFQLEGGIIKYASQVKSGKLENLFKGKNFVFDERLGERISEDVISRCHQCGKLCDHHTNCQNTGCNLLFIQCDECREKMEGCCSDQCRDIIHLPSEEQKKRRKSIDPGIRIYTKGRFSLIS